MSLGFTMLFVHQRSSAVIVFPVQSGRTPILIAAENGHTDLVRKLAGQYDGDIFHRMKVRIMEVLLIYRHLHLHTHDPSVTVTQYHVRTPSNLLQNSQNALHLAAYRGHLPVLQYLCSKFGDRVLDRDENDETCLDIAHRLGRRVMTEYLTENYPQLERKVRLVAGMHIHIYV